jgi:DNA-binding MarR family transcriptional regulator
LTYTDFFKQFIRAEIELWNSLTIHLSAEVGISLPQLQGLVAIDKFDGAARVQDISDEMLITVGATSKLVDRLERDGHAARRSNPDDRRSSIVVLTKEGAQFLSAGVDASEKYLSEILQHSFSESRAAELASELLTLRTRISQTELP